jgi:carbon monoxide dehydrogenase subunit G
VRVDHHCTGATEGERYAWAQEIDGTPFEKVLRSATLEIRLERRDGDTVVTLVGDDRLRGLSRLGSPMMRRAMRRRLEEALDGIERALVDASG